MIILFQILFSFFSLFAIVSVIKKRKDGLLGVKGMVFWVLFWLVAVVVVLWPNSATIIANTVGIGRGTDLTLYISVAALFFLLFRLHIKIEAVGRDITKLVRERAIEGVEEKIK